MKVKIKKEDTVKIIAGRDRGKTGRVLQVDAEKGKVLVEGVSLVKRHTRPNPQKQIKGGIANVVCGSEKRRVGKECRIGCRSRLSPSN